MLSKERRGDMKRKEGEGERGGGRKRLGTKVKKDTEGER